MQYGRQVGNYFSGKFLNRLSFLLFAFVLGYQIILNYYIPIGKELEF